MAMVSAASATANVPSTASMAGSGSVSPRLARGALAIAILAAIVVGLWAMGGDATSQAVSLAGADLSRLLRAMAALKALMAGCAAAAVWWRLGVPVTRSWLAGYLTACAAMAVGPGIIWAMAHVGLGAALLHGGLLATVLLLWRDPVVPARLSAIVAARRATLRAGVP